jgi:hypothetical protein
MITFAGFSALLLGLRQAAGARLSLLDRYLAKTVMSYIFVLTAAGACLDFCVLRHSMSTERDMYATQDDEESDSPSIGAAA